MEITNNLNQDIIHAPQWFKDAIEDKPSSEIIKNPHGIYPILAGTPKMKVKI